ncbi:MAG: FdtA/QdtA family cupin domain-containing protein [Muribaculaceae bacterium]|nr:FdtA/QdtA family cupin domain-containing protein [Muribaculaceae bacterium]MDE6793366.1 FdtA/QdtA family cupin domain-containing protein [Muribaculaceae bacterium]
MKDTSVYDCSVIELIRHHTDRQGNLTVVENGKTVPFDVRRIYYLYDVPGGVNRGGHAHREQYQLIVAVSGSFSVTLDDGNVRRTFLLNHPYQGLLVTPRIWNTLDDFSSGAVCMVLASDIYDEEEYVRDYDDFINLKHRSAPL